MSDPRLTPANGRVAAAYLRGQVEAERFVDGTLQEIAVPVADLRRTPGGRLDRQLLLGTQVTLWELHEGYAYISSTETGYTGYVTADHIAKSTTPDLTVRAQTTQVYAEPDLKAPALKALPFGARLRQISTTDTHVETPYGFVPRSHVRSLEPSQQNSFSDPVEVARMFLGTPYLWGGDSSWGIDCSGLVHAAMRAFGIECPGDSDLQEASLGAVLPRESQLQRGDVVFWRGHVGLMSDAETLLHATAHEMVVKEEPFDAAVARIIAQGDGPVTSRRRVTLPRG